MKRMVFWIVVAVAVGFAAYVRLAPSDPAVWHKGTGQSELGETRRDNSFVWREEVAGDGKARLAQIDAVIMATARTTRLAGSVEAGQITYVTRSKVMGFPDYTTVGIYGATPKYIEIFGRLRFGRSDLGVNAKRIKSWLAAL